MTNLINLGGGNTDFYIGDKQARIYLGETLLYPLDTPEPEEGQYHLSDFSRDASDYTSLKDGDKVIIVWAGENSVGQTIDTPNLSSYMLAPQGGYLKNLASYNNDNNTKTGPTPSDNEFIDAAVWEVAKNGNEYAFRNVKTGLWMYNDDESNLNNHKVTFGSKPYYFTIGRLKIGDAVSFTVTSNSTIEVNNYYHYNYDFEWYQTGTAGGNIFLFYKFKEPKNYLAKLNDSIEIPCTDDGVLDEMTVISYQVSIESVEFGDCLKVIGAATFDNCTNLKGSLVIPDSVTEIGMNAFLYDSGLTGTLEIPGSITAINEGSFKACGFDALILPASITLIGEDAFYACSNLKSIMIKSITPPELRFNTPFNTGAFDGSDCPIYVPCDSVDAYKAAPNWSKYADRIQGWDFDNDSECGKGGTVITYSDGATKTINKPIIDSSSDVLDGFHTITDIVKVTIGPVTEQIVEPVFRDAYNLTQLEVLPNSKLSYIGPSTFRYTGLLDVDLSNCKYLTEVASYSFQGCKELKTFILPSVDTSNKQTYRLGSIISDSMALTKVVIGKGCVDIGQEAFQLIGLIQSCDVWCLEDEWDYIPKLGYHALGMPPEMINIYVPINTIKNYQNASGWSEYVDYNKISERDYSGES